MPGKKNVNLKNGSKHIWDEINDDPNICPYCPRKRGHTGLCDIEYVERLRRRSTPVVEKQNKLAEKQNKENQGETDGEEVNAANILAPHQVVQPPPIAPPIDTHPIAEAILLLSSSPGAHSEPHPEFMHANQVTTFPQVYSEVDQIRTIFSSMGPDNMMLGYATPTIEQEHIVTVEDIVSLPIVELHNMANRFGMPLGHRQRFINYIKMLQRNGA
jgi:hypothetical protein